MFRTNTIIRDIYTILTKTFGKLFLLKYIAILIFVAWAVIAFNLLINIVLYLVL